MCNLFGIWQVTGDATEAQILLSVKSYIHHRDLLLLSINNLFHLFKYSQCRDHQAALEVLSAVLGLLTLDVNRRSFCIDLGLLLIHFSHFEPAWVKPIHYNLAGWPPPLTASAFSQLG